jgi:hypothetical protein
MPNPFPGMNPYLEDPAHWRGIHTYLLTYIHSALNRALPDAFVVRTEERIYVEGWDQVYYPDEIVVQIRPVSSRRGGVATLEPLTTQQADSDVPLRLNLGGRTVREAFLEIRTVDDNSELIAVIELLSPTNKTTGPGREEYQRKQRDVKNSLVHLVEIDLLRGGAYTVAPDERGTRTRAGHFDYIVSLHRGGDGEIYDVWPVTVRERLPRLSIPLTEEVRPVALDLQDIVNRIYEDGVLEKGIRYDRDPIPPLTGEDAAWADALLRAKGLR